MAMVSFSVGKKERHLVQFEYSRIFNRYKVSVDNFLMQKGFYIIAVGTRNFDFDVGEKEIHNIRLVHRRRTLMLHSILYVWLDNKPFKTLKV